MICSFDSFMNNVIQQTLKLTYYQTLFNVVITRCNPKSHKNKALTYEDNAHNNLMVMLMVVSAALKNILPFLTVGCCHQINITFSGYLQEVFLQI